MLPIDPKDHIDDIHIPAQVSLGILSPEEHKDLNISNSTGQTLKKISKQLEDTHLSLKLISTFDKIEYLEAAEEVLKYDSPGTPLLEIVLTLSKDNLPLFDKSPAQKSIYKGISKEIRCIVLKRLKNLKIDRGHQFQVIVSLTALVDSGLKARRIMEIKLEKQLDTLKIIDCNYFNEEIEVYFNEYTGLKKFYDEVIENLQKNNSKIDDKIEEYVINNSNILILISKKNPYPFTSLKKNPLQHIKKEYHKHWINPESGCKITEEDEDHIYKYIKRVGKTIFWIDPVNSEFKKGKGKDKSLRSLEHFNIFNKEKMRTSELEEKIKENSEKLVDRANDAKLPIKYLDSIITYLIPYISKSSVLAAKYQRWDKWTNDLLYLLSILAVLVVTIQLIFSPTEILWIILEVIFISIILFILLASRQYDWHRKWVEYRFLSESLRSFPYLFLVEIECGIDNMLPHLIRTKEDWVERAYEYITGQFEIEECKLDDKDKIPFKPLKELIIISWIESQRKFYQNGCTKNMRKHKFFYYLSLNIFILTLGFAIIHAYSMYAHFTGFELVHSSLILAVIVLPAAGAAIAGLRIQKEYLRNWKRYENMAYHLSKLEDEISEANDEETLKDLIKEANSIMNLEHQDWKIAFSFHKTEPH